MTEFNAQEIINFLNDKLKKKVKSLLEEYLLGDEKVYDLELSIAIEENTEDVRKVERYAVNLEAVGLRCPACRISQGDGKCNGCKIVMNKKTKIGEMCNWEPKYSIEDFK